MSKSLRTNLNVPKKEGKSVKFFMPPTEEHLPPDLSHEFTEGNLGVTRIEFGEHGSIRIVTVTGVYTYHGVPYLLHNPDPES